MSVSKISLLEAFKWRHSVRNFAGGFPAQAKAIVANAVIKADDWESPFSTKTTIRQTSKEVGTFGVVSNASGCLMTCVPKGIAKQDKAKAMCEAGVRGQVALMELAQHKIGTVWLGGSYRKGVCDALSPGFDTIAMIPYGVGEREMGTVGKIAKWLSQSATRKPLNEIFYDMENKKPFTEETAKDLLPMMMALRSGPSAVNVQPWRFVVDGKKMHIFNAKKTLISMLDVGIAIANTQLLAIDMNHKPNLSFVNGVTPYLGGTYVCTCSFRD